MIERTYDTEEARIAFCSAKDGRIKPRDEATAEHFGASLRAVCEVGFRAGIEKAIEMVSAYNPGDVKPEDLPRYIAAYLIASKDWS